MILQKNARPNLDDMVSTLEQMTDEDRNLIGEYLKIEKCYRYALREMSARLENLDDNCSLHFAHNPIHHIESRVKTPAAIIEKIHRRGYPVTMEILKEKIYDIAGMRVICNYINDIYQIVTMMKQQKDLKIKISKDYIRNPKPTGYRSLHIVFEMAIYVDNIQVYVPIEIQFRTIAMDMWASLEHELRYKSKGFVFSDEDKDNLKLYSDQLYQIDLSMQRMYITKIIEEEEND
ncbi:MAG: GTP pyrophosphokinase family protein [Acholeplasmatales bacterium]|nr:GTP pyrophosphokinase family protein [Acholeplasmatales bacterium]MBQ4356866.1 GTP pyrophosphokinase family protein [Acholeplasmatales bacterium]